MATCPADEICPDRTDCRCAEAKGMQSVLRPARENRAVVCRAGFGAEIRESRVRLCGDNEMVA